MAEQFDIFGEAQPQPEPFHDGIRQVPDISLKFYEVRVAGQTIGRYDSIDAAKRAYRRVFNGTQSRLFEPQMEGQMTL